MGSQWNEDLRRRQAAGDTGHAVLGSPDRIAATTRAKWKPAILSVAVLALGLLLAFVGPVPGLGVILIIGGGLALPVSVVMVLLGPENPPPIA